MARTRLLTAALVLGLLAAPGGALGRQPLPGHDQAADEDRRSLRPAGPLQGAWRVVRAGDPADAAVMLVSIIHDGRTLEGDYVLFQPFCEIEQRLPVSGAESCEFIDLSGGIEEGRLTSRRASIVLRPGADGLAHRLVFNVRPSAGPLRGRYYAPGDRVGTAIVLSRAPD